MQFHFKCETLRVLAKQLRYYNKKTDRFRLTNHSRPCKQLKYYNHRITRVFIASVFTELEPKYKNIRSCNHQSIYLRHDKAKKERKVGVRKFWWEAALEEADKDSTDSEAWA